MITTFGIPKVSKVRLGKKMIRKVVRDKNYNCSFLRWVQLGKKVFKEVTTNRMEFFLVFFFENAKN